MSLNSSSNATMPEHSVPRHVPCVRNAKLIRGFGPPPGPDWPAMNASTKARSSSRAETLGLRAAAGSAADGTFIHSLLHTATSYRRGRQPASPSARRFPPGRSQSRCKGQQRELLGICRRRHSAPGAVTGLAYCWQLPHLYCCTGQIGLWR